MQTRIETLSLPNYLNSAMAIHNTGIYVPVDRAFLAAQISPANQAILHFECDPSSNHMERVDFMAVTALVSFDKQSRVYLGSAYSTMNMTLFHFYEGSPF